MKSLGAMKGLSFAVLAEVAVILFVFWAAEPEWRVTNIRDNQLINPVETLSFTHPAAIRGDIWVIQRQENGKYYPMAAEGPDPDAGCEITLVETEGTVSDQQIRMGEPDDYDKRYTILITTATKDASQLIVQTLQQWCQAKHFPGLANLPQGVTIHEQIQVIRAPKPLAGAPWPVGSEQRRTH
ncbi:MAG: hypothetical protein M3Q71_12885 [Chloroflexota bacterium]|nr:hypothetical protein [Chloroflexota bacterium]